MLKFAVQASDTLAHRTLYDPISKLNAVMAVAFTDGGQPYAVQMAGERMSPWNSRLKSRKSKTRLSPLAS
jgi:hypothetical protein